MKLFSSILSAAALAAVGALTLQSASYAQSAAGLATSITTDNITAAGVAATLENSFTGVSQGFFASGLSAGVAGSTATLCLDSATSPIVDPFCFAGSESVVTGALSGTGVVAGGNEIAVIGASALPQASLPPGPPIPAGGNVVVLFDNVFTAP